jgi:hypothetical protein
MAVWVLNELSSSAALEHFIEFSDAQSSLDPVVMYSEAARKIFRVLHGDAAAFRCNPIKLWHLRKPNQPPSFWLRHIAEQCAREAACNYAK